MSRYEEERFGAQHTPGQGNRRPEVRTQKGQSQGTLNQRSQPQRDLTQNGQIQRTSAYRGQVLKGQVSRGQNLKYQSEEVRKASYQPGDIQRRQQAAYEAQRRRPVNDIRTQRYQQESLAGDWQQDWERTPYDNRNDKRFTGGQLALTLVIITLVLAMTAMAAFWYTGRSSLRNHADTGVTAEQNDDRTVQDEVTDDNIVILDVDGNE